MNHALKWWLILILGLILEEVVVLFYSYFIYSSLIWRRSFYLSLIFCLIIDYLFCDVNLNGLLYPFKWVLIILFCAFSKLLFVFNPSLLSNSWILLSNSWILLFYLLLLLLIWLSLKMNYFYSPLKYSLNLLNLF